MLIALIALALSTLLWKQESGMRNASGDQTTQLQQSLTELKTSFLQFRQQTQQSISTTQNDIAQLMNQADQTASQKAVLDTDYLIRLANLHLVVEKNVSLGIRLLKMAQQRLQPMTTESLAPLKQALATDIAAVSSVPQINPSELIASIDSINDQIANLPSQPESAPQVPAKTETTPAAPGKSWWDKVKHNLSGLQNLFIIHRIDQPISPIVGPEQILAFEKSRKKR